MQSADATGRVPIPWWRFLLITALVTVLYFAVRFTVTPPQTHPALLLPTLLLGAVVSAVAARSETTADGNRRGGRGLRQGHRHTVSEARWYVFGLAGAGLVLAQVLQASALEWLVLGLTALTTGGASHAWVTERRQLGTGN